MYTAFLQSLYFVGLRLVQDLCRTTEYPDLEGTHKGHKVQLLMLLFLSIKHMGYFSTLKSLTAELPTAGTQSPAER